MSIVIGTHQLERLRKHFAELAEGLHTDELADKIGVQQADSARRRIRESKRGPNGKRWPAWSERYAKTRKGQHSLLVSTGALADSLTHNVLSPTRVLVGSNLVYAAVHLYGNSAQGIPARPYLDTDGRFADEHDREEIRDIVRGMFERGAIR